MMLPRTGRSIYGWAKEIERVFDKRVVSGMTAHGKDLGLPQNIVDWDEEATRTVCLGVVEHLMTSPKYEGQFDYLHDDLAQYKNQSQQHEKPATPGVNVADLRKILMTKMQALSASRPAVPQRSPS